MNLGLLSCTARSIRLVFVAVCSVALAVRSAAVPSTASPTTFYENRHACQDGIFAVASCAEAVHPSISGSLPGRARQVRTWHRKPRRHILRELGQDGDRPAQMVVGCSPGYLRSMTQEPSSLLSFFFFLNNAVVVSLLFLLLQAAGTWLNRTPPILPLWLV